MTNRWLTGILILPTVFFSAGAQAEKLLPVKSPDRHIAVNLSVEAGQVEWCALLDGVMVLEKAPLEISGGEPSTGPVHFGRTRRYRINDSYPWYGVHSVAEERGSGLEVPLLAHDGTVAWILEIRAYDNGIAFRMTLPGTEPRVPQETAAFRPVAGSAVWSFDPTYGHYEGVYQKSEASSTPKGRFMAPPVTIELPGDSAYLAITEGRLQNYPGMVLQSDGTGTFFARPGDEVPADKALIYFQGADMARRLAVPAVLSGTIVTPWRVVMIARNLNELVNNDIVSDVSDSPDPKIFPEGPRTAWIRPGRAVWNFLDGGANTLEGSKDVSKMAAELGFEYQEVEGYWENWTEAQIKELVDYSRKLGVGIWLWKNRRELSTRENREAFFDLCNRTGVVGVKIDFFDSEAKDVVDLYQELLQETAAHHLMVNFHGSNKPTGEQRTWPNELTREAVEGMEYCCTDTGQPDAPRARHAATIPFTRLLAGPADYTPMLFDKGLNGTTWANQIASAVIITSPLLTIAANPKTILSNPAVQVIRDISPVWDETIVLPPSRIGELVILARRKGDRWFLACMNGDAPQSFDVPLRFLGSGGWTAQTVSDVANKAAAVHVEAQRFNADGVIHLALAPGGGYVAKFGRE